MAGNKEGGDKTREKLLAKDPNYYVKIGRKGGSAKKTSPAGFAYLKSIGNLEAIRNAGRIGGAISKPYSKKFKNSQYERWK